MCTDNDILTKLSIAIVAAMPEKPSRDPSHLRSFTSSDIHSEKLSAQTTSRGVASIEAEEVVASLFADLVVRWVRTNPPSSLQYQLFLRVELILDCKHSKNSLAAG